MGSVQLEEPVATGHDAPKLLVEWSSPWREFVTSLRPAIGRSEPRLAGEAPFGLIPLRIMAPSYVVEAFLIFVAILAPPQLARLRPYVAPRIASHDVIYYSGDELPRTEDLGGAQAGAEGRAGGDEAHHRTQTIKVARGGSLTPRVVDAPNLRLAPTKDAVANLLAIEPDAGPPPSEGLRSSRRMENLSAVVAPAPNVTRDYTRNGIALNTVVPPTPNFSANQPLNAPSLNANVIPPAPNVSGTRLVAPALGPAVIPPAPTVRHDRSLHTPSLNADVIAPAPSSPEDAARTTPSLAARVIPPAPGGVSRDISRSTVQMTSVTVVPPPVSAPERATSRTSKMTLPAPSVIAPPPSTDVSQDLRRLASGSAPDASKNVVPPPPTQSGSGSFMSSLIGRIFGTSEVVPPPPTVKTTDTRSSAGTALAANVVPPPPSVAGGSGGNPHGARNGAGAAPGSNVIAPPPSAGISAGGAARSLAPAAAPALGPPSVVPPPPQLSGPGGGTGKNGGGAGVSNGTLLANNVVPPPPSVGAGAGAGGSGMGRANAGLGRPLDVGSAAAPAASGGSGNNAGTVMSSQPGSKVGLPTTGGTGSLALSPSGGEKVGLGGSGAGTGIGRGAGPGSSVNGNGAGAGKNGAGKGSDTNANAGISPNPGPAGAGSAPSGNPPIRGVEISGGSSVVTLPSFGSDPAANDPSAPGRSTIKGEQTLGVTIVATASSGGAFEPYKNLLHGQTYTTYFDTSLGTAVMEFANEAGAPGDMLTAPQSIRTDLPAGLPRARMVLKCTLDASGNLRNLRVLEPGPAVMTAKVVAALRGWKFQPAMRGNQPVEVTAILGFGINTDDRF